MNFSKFSFILRASTFITLAFLTLSILLFPRDTLVLGKALVNQMGMSGLFMMAFVMDVIINPISPDLLVFGKSGLQSIHPTWLIALVGGSASVCAGIVGYGIGTLIQTNQLMGMIGAKHYQSTHRLFKTKGHWAVLIGALSPIPFSAVCWSAGFFQMTFRVFFITVLCTRLPRFLAMAYLGSFFI